MIPFIQHSQNNVIQKWRVNQQLTRIRNGRGKVYLVVARERDLWGDEIVTYLACNNAYMNLRMV